MPRTLFPLPEGATATIRTKHDTKRWCRGQRGHEHDWQVVDLYELDGHHNTMRTMHEWHREAYIPECAYLIDFCSKCGKQGKWHESIPLTARGRRRREGQAIGDQIRRARTRRQWTQTELGRRAGMTQEAICGIENPAYERQSVSTLKRVAAALDLNLIICLEELNA